MRSWGKLALLALGFVFAGCHGSVRPTAAPAPSAAATSGTIELAQPRTPAVASSPGTTPGGWRRVGPMAVARILHTATLLPSGQVLIVGGESDVGPAIPQGTASVELYDPTSGAFHPAASLHVGREEHTATLLPDGRVLIAGGSLTPPAGKLTATAELYDPRTGSWTLAAPMHAPRWSAAATVLPSGQVLVAGGNVVGSTAELYDPATDTWTETGPMVTPDRRGSSALPLPDGGVVLLGGTTGVDARAEPERYDPASKSWRTATTPRMDYGRAVAALADGRVLAAGPNVNYLPHDPRPPQPADAEVYDPATDTWTPTGPLPDPTDAFLGTAVRLADGRVLVVGGKHAQIYDPATNRWTATANPNACLYARAATPLRDGSVLVTGGEPDGRRCTGTVAATNVAEVFTP